MSDTPPPVPSQSAAFPDTSPKPISGFSIASMILGISSIVCCYPFALGIITGPLAVIFYFVARKAHREGRGGQGMSLAGLICGICGILLTIAYLGVIVFAFFMAAQNGGVHNRP